jgi:phosphatidate cytidylyltransferase
MKRVLTAVVLVPLVLLAVFRAPIWLFALLVGAVIVLALHEYLAIAEAAGIKPFHWLTYIVALLPLALFLVYQIVDLLTRDRQYAGYPSEFVLFRVLGSLAFVMPVIFGVPLVFRKELSGGLASSAASIMGILYIAVSLSLLVLLRLNPMQSILIVFVLLSVWMGDTSAYYVGRSLGKHKLAPRVSPNKSWEGAIASVIASVAVAFVVLYFTPTISGWFASTGMYASRGLRLAFYRPYLWHALVLGVLTNVAAQFGDLFESALKRSANLKDSGTLLPGHGGVLDRIDALLFAIPVVWYYALLTARIFLTATFE